jgi:hypothetical protein
MAMVEIQCCKVIDAAPSNIPHQTDSRLPVRACPPVLLMNRTDTMVTPAGLQLASMLVL